MFGIDKGDPYHPRVIGEPASTLGYFPITTAYAGQLEMRKVTTRSNLATR